jgi:hypothetical protein
MRLCTLFSINDDRLHLDIDPPPIDNSVSVASLEYGGTVLIRDIFDFGRGGVETCDHEEKVYRRVGSSAVITWKILDEGF